MIKKLLDLSGKIDTKTVELFEIVDISSKSLKTPFFVIGAKARDFILMNAFNIRTNRATLDIDFGIQVSNWDQFKNLKEALIATGKFKATNLNQRLNFNDTLYIDIVPFGDITEHDKSLKWPPDHEIEMSTKGFEEAFQHSLMIRLRSNPVLDVRLADLSGLAIMKIISWDEKYPERSKDAQDLLLILKNYLDAGNDERLYSEEADLLDENFDYTRAGARLLGRDIASVSTPETLQVILDIINRETDENGTFKLSRDMIKNVHSWEDELNESIKLLEELKFGMLDVINKL